MKVERSLLRILKLQIILLVSLGSLVLTLASCRIEDKGRGKPLTHRAIISLNVGIRDALDAGKSPEEIEEMTPKELFDFMDSINLIYYDSWLGQKEVRDAWGNPFEISVGEDDFKITSPGKDQIMGTADDIAETFLISP